MLSKEVHTRQQLISPLTPTPRDRKRRRFTHLLGHEADPRHGKPSKTTDSPGPGRPATGCWGLTLLSVEEVLLSDRSPFSESFLPVLRDS